MRRTIDRSFYLNLFHSAGKNVGEQADRVVQYPNKARRPCPSATTMDTLVARALQKRLSDLTDHSLAGLHVALLPDFFLDHLLTITSTPEYDSQIHRLAAQGGGNYPHIPQTIQQGGNAANTALGLARLGVQTHLLCRTSPLGQHLLQYFLGPAGVDLTHVKTDGRLALTTALELQDQHANVMLGDPGSVADFSPDLLTDQDYDCIAEADLVAVANWNLNSFGTALARDVFQFAKQHNVITYFDTGDPSPKLHEVPTLMRDVINTPLLDVFGLNENELRHYSGRVSSTHEEIVAAAQVLKQKTTARLDLHTSTFSCSLDSTCTIMPTEHLPTIMRTTGAGDAWNAANILATLLMFPAPERLAFANLVAGLYVSSIDPQLPSLNHVRTYLRTK